MAPELVDGQFSIYALGLEILSKSNLKKLSRSYNWRRLQLARTLF